MKSAKENKKAQKILYKSKAFEAIHKSARALEKVRAIDKQTMRNFDMSCTVMTRAT